MDMKVNNQLDSTMLRTNATNVANSSSETKIKSESGFKEETRQEQGLSEQLAKLTQRLNQQMDSLGTNIKFGFNDKINSMYISVTEKYTGKEIRQIPSEEAMRLAEHFKDVIGLIFDKES